MPVEGQLFGLLDTLPLGSILGVIAMTLVAIFFVSGADAASIVMGTLSQRGTIHPDRKARRLLGRDDGSVAALMLVVGGSDALSGIQNITIIMAAPFVLVMIVMCVALTRTCGTIRWCGEVSAVAAAMEQAVDYGTENYGDGFFLHVKPNKDGEASDVEASTEATVSPNGHAPRPGATAVAASEHTSRTRGPAGAPAAADPS